MKPGTRLLLGTLPALTAIAAGCGSGEAHDGPSEPGDPAAGSAPPALSSFDCAFEDVTEESGIAFVHATGGRGQKLLPETMGSGACLFDVDADGALDLFLVNSGALDHGDGEEGPGADARSALYLGRGDGTFRDASRERGADFALYGMGAAAADFDADGDRDLYVTALGRDALLVNDGARFREGAEAAGLVDPGWTDRAGTWHPSWSTAAAWLDADADGDLDLFVGGYCQWTPELEIFTTLDGVRKAFTTPDRYQGLAPRLYANQGDGTFARVVDAALDGAIGKTLGVATWDLDEDGFQEILVANDTRKNFCLRRNADGSWREVGEEVGIAYDENGRARAGMGIDVVALEEDEGTYLAIGNFAGEPMSLYRWDGDSFRSRTAPAGLARATVTELMFGLRFCDLDLDGRLDLAVINGHIEPEIASFRPDERHAQPGQLYRGIGAGRFAPVGDAAGDLAGARVGRGLAAGDVDGDGDLDLVVTRNGGAAVLLRNGAQEVRPRRYLRVRLVGHAGNPDALGAVVTLHAGGRVQRRTVRTGSSYLSQGETVVTFGLGDVDRAERIDVRWPSGRIDRHEDPALNTTVMLREP